MPKTNEKAKNLRKCIKSPKMPKITKIAKSLQKCQPSQNITKNGLMLKMADFWGLFSYLRGSGGLSGRRARRTKSGPKGPQLKVITIGAPVRANMEMQSWRQGKCSRSYKLYIAYIFIQCWLLLERRGCVSFLLLCRPPKNHLTSQDPNKGPICWTGKLGSDGALDGITWECILRSSVVLSSTRSFSAIFW